MPTGLRDPNADRRTHPTRSLATSATTDSMSPTPRTSREGGIVRRHRRLPPTTSTTIRRVIRASCRYHRPGPGRTGLSGLDDPITNLRATPADTLSWHLGACQLDPAETARRGRAPESAMGRGSAHVVMELSTGAQRPCWHDSANWFVQAQ